MPAFLLPIISSILPWIVGILGAVGAFFYVKRQGAKEERAAIKEKQAETIAAHKEKVVEAVSKDKVIDKTVGEKIDAIKPKKDQPGDPDSVDSFKPGDIFKF